MNSANFWARCLLLTCLLALGCNSKPGRSTAGNSEDGEVADPKATKVAKKGLPVKEEVKDVIGNWVVVITNQRSDLYRWLIKFSRDADGKIVCEFLDTRHDTEEHDKPEIVETTVNDNQIHLVMKNEHATFKFDGSLQERFIRGTFKLSPVELLLTRMLPTDESTLEKFPKTGLPPGTDVFETKMKSKDFNPDEFLGIIKEYRTSPAAQDMYAMMLGAHGQAKFDENKVKEIIDDFLSSAKIWGPAWEARTEITIALSLINGRQFTRLALSHLDAVEKLMGDDFAAIKDSMTSYREAANSGIRVLELMDPKTTDEVRAEGYRELTESLKKQPYNAEILLALATQADRMGQVDPAIEYLSDIVALPLLEGLIMQLRAGQPPDTPSPHELLKKLWNQKHGSEDGYDKQLKDVYEKKIGALITEMKEKSPAVPAADASTKVVLVEEFTGMLCAPCVAADLALSGINQTYPPGKVAVLQFHQNVPGPDGLANQDSEERAQFYELPGFPTIVVDGMPIINRFYAGPIQTALGGYGVLRQVIDPRLLDKTVVAIQSSAVVTNGTLEIKAEATGIPEDVLPSCRLRMAIAENHVQSFVPMSTNGIRDHEYVVRELLGGGKGIPPKNGELKYSIKMPVSDLQQHVKDYIAKFEAGRRMEFLPEMKPPIRGPLSLVTWVQNGTPDETTKSRMVLQAAIIPIEGDTGFEPKADSAAAEPTKNAAEPAATTPDEPK